MTGRCTNQGVVDEAGPCIPGYCNGSLISYPYGGSAGNNCSMMMNTGEKCQQQCMARFDMVGFHTCLSGEFFGSSWCLPSSYFDAGWTTEVVYKVKSTMQLFFLIDLDALNQTAIMEGLERVVLKTRIQKQSSQEGGDGSETLPTLPRLKDEVMDGNLFTISDVNLSSPNSSGRRLQVPQQSVASNPDDTFLHRRSVDFDDTEDDRAPRILQANSTNASNSTNVSVAPSNTTTMAETTTTSAQMTSMNITTVSSANISNLTADWTFEVVLKSGATLNDALVASAGIHDTASKNVAAFKTDLEAELSGQGVRLHTAAFTKAPRAYLDVLVRNTDGTILGLDNADLLLPATDGEAGRQEKESSATGIIIIIVSSSLLCCCLAIFSIRCRRRYSAEACEKTFTDLPDRCNAFCLACPKRMDKCGRGCLECTRNVLHKVWLFIAPFCNSSDRGND